VTKTKRIWSRWN